VHMLFSAWLQNVASLEAVCSLCRRGSGSSTSHSLAGKLACNVHCDAVICSAHNVQVDWTQVLEQCPYISAYCLRVGDEARPPANRTLYGSRSGSSLGSGVSGRHQSQESNLSHQEPAQQTPATGYLLIPHHDFHSACMLNVCISQQLC